MGLNLANAEALAAALIKRLEACKLVGYPDTGGKPTNGYGHTGPGVKVGQRITQEIADHLLQQDLAQAHESLSRVIFGHEAGLSDHQYAALLSFVFNLGAKEEWTIWKDINTGKLADVPAQMMRFDHGLEHGRLVEIPGLKNRRLAERAYWLTADVPETVAVTAQATSVSSGYTRPLPTPPVPVPTPPLASTSLVAKVTTTIAGLAAAAGTAGTQVHDIVAPHASEAQIFSTIAVAATGLVVAASILGLMVHAQQAHLRTL